MMRFIDSYFEYLANHPTTVNSIILWTVTVCVIWFLMFRLKRLMVQGATGVDGLLQLAEQISYISLWLLTPIISYFAYFKDSESTLYFLGAIVAYTIGGRWLFQWALAFRSGKTTVEENPTQTPNQK
jgi:hypothetical protein